MFSKLTEKHNRIETKLRQLEQLNREVENRKEFDELLQEVERLQLEHSDLGGEIDNATNELSDINDDWEEVGDEISELENSLRQFQKDNFFRAFTKEDWMAFAGAEEKHGQPPMIKEFEGDNDYEYVVVFDINTLTVFKFHKGEATNHEAQIDFFWMPPEERYDAYKMIAERLNLDAIRGMEFKEV